MWKLLALALLVTLASCYEQEYWDRVNDYEVVTKITFAPGRVSKRMGQEERRLVMHRANGEKYVFRCIQYSAFAPDAIIEVHDGDKKITVPVPTNSYKAIGNGHRNLRFIAHEDGTFSGAFTLKGDRVVFDPASTHKEWMHDHHKAKLNSDDEYVLIRESMMDEDEREHSCGVEGHDHKHNILGKRSTQAAPSGNTFPLVPPPSPCPQGQMKQVMQSVIADAGFTTVVGGQQAAIDYINQAWMDVNVYYESDFNVHLTISFTLIKTSVDSEPWNTGASGCPSINTKLDQATAWKNANRQSDGLLHLMTNCYPSPGTIGLAWVGVVCSTRNGAGVSNHLRSRHTAHRVIGHETGHNFDCPHDEGSDGIMFPSVNNNPSKDYERFSRVSQGQACRHLGNVQCLTNYDSGCTLDCTNKECGPSNCAGRMCGQPCQGFDTCENGRCVACQPTCGSKTCGPDNCGNANGCGTCTGQDEICSVSGQCTVERQYPDNVVDAINTERAKYNVAPLAWDTGILNQINTHLASSCSRKNPMIGGDLTYTITTSAPGPVDVLRWVNVFLGWRDRWTCATNQASDATSAWYYGTIVNEKSTKFACVGKVCSGKHYVYCAFDQYFPYGGSARPFPVDQCDPCSVTPNPNVCADQQKQCGTANDGCKDVSCGTCSAPNTCDSNQRCVCTPTTTTCPAGACGSLPNGCGTNLNCGSCPTGQNCENNVCVTPPPDPPTPAECNAMCNTQGRECGGISECPGHSCGSCTSGSMCSNYKCVTCQGCHAQATCDLSGSTPQCKCIAGFTGDGQNCVPTPINLPTFSVFSSFGDIRAWDIFPAGDSVQNQIHQTGANSMHCIKWDETDDLVKQATTKLAVSILRTDDTTFAGLGFLMGPSGFSNLVVTALFRGSSATQAQFGFRYFQGPGSFSGITWRTVAWPVGTWKDVSVEIEGGGSRNLVASLRFGDNPGSRWTYRLNGAPVEGHLGFCAQGKASFRDVAVSTQSKVTFVMSGCPTEAFIRTRLQTLLNVDAAAIGGMTLENSGCSSKRQAAAGASTTVTATFVGTKAYSSVAMAANLQNLVTSGSTAAASSGIGSTVTATAVPVTGTVVASTAATVGAGAGGAAAGGLGTGAIVGIAVGAVAGVAIVAAAIGGVVYATKGDDISASEMSSPPPAEPKGVSMAEGTKPQGKDVRDGVNVMGGPKRPDGPSITARNQNVVVSPNAN